MARKGSLLLRALVVCAVAGCSSALYACGGSDTESGSAQAATVPRSVLDTVEEWSERPAEIGITEPITKPIPKGKRIDVVTCNVPGCDAVKGFQDAAELLGWDVKVYPADQTPQGIATAFEAVMRDKPDAMVALSIVPDVAPHELDRIKEMGIPVVGVQNPTSGMVEAPNVAVMFDHKTNELQGEVQGNLVAAHGCTNVVYANFSGFPILIEIQNSFEKTLKEIVPGSKVAPVIIPLQQIQNATSLIVSAVRSNPDSDCIQLANNVLEPGLVAALKTAALEGRKIFVSNGNQLTLDEIRKGDVTATLPPNIMGDWGYMIADALARHFAGQSTQPSTDAVLPFYIIDKQNLPEELPETVVPSAPDQWAQLWGVE